MPLRSSPSAPLRYDARVERKPDPKHVFDRDPLLIPQLFTDGRPRWYRRPIWWLAILASVGVVSAMGVLVARHGPRGALTRVGHVGVVAMRAYTRIIAGRPASSPYHH